MESRIQRNKDLCFICKKPIYGRGDLHHVFNGANKRKAEEDGMVCYVHRCCHRWIHDHSLSFLQQKANAQKVWEETGTREEFIERYGVSYIDELEYKLGRKGWS